MFYMEKKYLKIYYVLNNLIACTCCKGSLECEQLIKDFFS